jgi:DNA-directed RNA polymerase subunit omega
MIYPKVEDLLDRVDSKFSLVTLAAYRARQINSYFNHLGEGLGHSIPPQVSSVARKPLSIAFEEIAADKIVKIDRLPYDEMEQEAAEIFGEFVTENVDDSESADEFASAVTEEAVTEVDDVRDDASTADADES